MHWLEITDEKTGRNELVNLDKVIGIAEKEDDTIRFRFEGGEQAIYKISYPDLRKLINAWHN